MHIVINTILLLLLAFVANAQKIIDVKKLGAVGDGKHNDYPALLKAAQLAAKTNNTEIVFPKGIYFLNVVHETGSSVSDIIFNNCSRLTIKGNNSIIRVNGNFIRKTDKIKGKIRFSNTQAIIPFYFTDCKNITVKDIEVDGSVDKMQREEGIAETGGHLLLFKDCEGVTIENVFVHHAQSDGVYIGGTRSAMFRVKNLKSSNNGRQGMSIIQLLGGNFDNCKFINTGITEGSYGSHAPRAGVDIEPRAGGISVRDIKFSNCTFENNLGSQFVCSTPKNTDNILLDKCRLVAASGKSAYQVLLAASNVVLQNCYIDCGPGNIYPIANSDPGSSVTIKNCTIKSAGVGIMSVSKLGKDQLTIDNNTIEYTGRIPVKKYFLYIQTEGATFTNNKILIPTQYHRKGAATSLIQKGKIASGNTFYSGNTISKPAVSYQGTKIVKDK